MFFNFFSWIIKTTNEQNYIRDKAYLALIREELIEKKIILKEIQTDFIKMKEIFNKNFDKLINNFIRIPKDEDISKNSKKEIELISFSYAIFFNKYLKDTQIRNIFFRDLLNFYDEYSYRINYNIQFLDLRYLLKKIENFKKTSSKSLINKENIELNDIPSFKYFDLFYWIKKLEKKISIKFHISIEEIRKILYKKSVDKYYI